MSRTSNQKSRVTLWLERTNKFSFSVFVIIAAFATYFCMYAFRKPFNAGTYDGLSLWGMDYKILLIITQVAGYTLSKLIGIKVISEMPAHRRIVTLVAFIIIAECALLLFAVVPYPYNFVFLFFNGLPLGMIWGLVYSFVEGRNLTEALAAGLSASVIISSGFLKTVGTYIMINWGVPEFWMPFTVGLIFFIPIIISIWMLSKIPAPTKDDEDCRTKRVPMDGKDRMNLFRKCAPGLIILILVHVALTIFRDFRDNFAVDIWQALGYNEPAIYTKTELPPGVLVLLILGSTFLIKNHKKAFWIVHLSIFLGAGIILFTTIFFQLKLISPFVWMLLGGLGLFAAYVSLYGIIFERFIAVFRCRGNAGYLIYLADSSGYIGSVGVLLYKNFWVADLSWLEFFISASYVIAIGIMILILLSYFYFRWRLKETE